MERHRPYQHSSSATQYKQYNERLESIRGEINPYNRSATGPLGQDNHAAMTASYHAIASYPSSSTTTQNVQQHSTSMQSLEQMERQRMLADIVSRGYDHDKAMHALQLTDYSSTEDAIEILRTLENRAALKRAQTISYNRVNIPISGAAGATSPPLPSMSRINISIANETPSRSSSSAALFSAPSHHAHNDAVMPRLRSSYASSATRAAHSIIVGDANEETVMPAHIHTTVAQPLTQSLIVGQTSPTVSTASSASRRYNIDEDSSDNDLLMKVHDMLKDRGLLDDELSHTSQLKWLPQQPAVTQIPIARAPVPSVVTQLRAPTGSKEQLPPTRSSPTTSATLSDHDDATTVEDTIVRCTSPLPDCCRGTDIESPIHAVQPRAFCFYMEQHIENVINQYEMRNKRWMMLERDIANAEFDEDTASKLRKILAFKENKYLRSSRQKLDESMFERIKTIGLGAYGKVTDTKTLYAMKILKKDEVIEQNQAAHVKAERDILAEANSEWIVKLYCSFQNAHNLFFILEYIPGGDMMALLIREEIFSEPMARFYIAELACAISYVHGLHFIHRDIKPDNILIDAQGHIKLTDFGLCTGLRWTHDKKYYHNREDSYEHLRARASIKGRPKLLDHRNKKRKRAAHSLVGTNNYMAPEVLKADGHDRLCDWWSTGVILYEMVVGRPPFYDDNPHVTPQKILNWRKYLEIPDYTLRNERLSYEVQDLIKRLCCDKEDRIGGKSDEEIKNHPWFEGIDFETIRNQPAPFVPTIKDRFDTSNFDEPDESDSEADNSSAYNTTPTTRADTRRQQAGAKSSKDHKHNPAFYEFTFRHFFDMEPYGPENLPVNARAHPTKRRPALPTGADSPLFTPPPRAEPPTYAESNNNILTNNKPSDALHSYNLNINGTPHFVRSQIDQDTDSILLSDNPRNRLLFDSTQYQRMQQQPAYRYCDDNYV